MMDPPRNTGTFDPMSLFVRVALGNHIINAYNGITPRVAASKTTFGDIIACGIAFFLLEFLLTPFVNGIACSLPKFLFVWRMPVVLISLLELLVPLHKEGVAEGTVVALDGNEQSLEHDVWMCCIV